MSHAVFNSHGAVQGLNRLPARETDWAALWVKVVRQHETLQSIGSASPRQCLHGGNRSRDSAFVDQSWTASQLNRFSPLLALARPRPARAACRDDLPRPLCERGDGPAHPRTSVAAGVEAGARDRCRTARWRHRRPAADRVRRTKWHPTHSVIPSIRPSRYSWRGNAMIRRTSFGSAIPAAFAKQGAQ